jgi:uncharacterized protein (DUF302 family)
VVWNALTFALCGFFAGLLVALVAVALSAPRFMIVEDRSTLPFDETVARIVVTAEARGWKVPTVHELDESVRKSGREVLPATVIELCRPDLAGEILAHDRGRAVTAMMPCRIAVHRTSDGAVVVSRMNTTLMAKLFGGVVAGVMARASADSEEILAAVLDQS